MIKPIKRSIGRAGSLKILKRRIDYLEDRNHADHQGLVIYSSKNYNCAGPKGADFQSQCLKSHKEYLSSPERSRGGKPNQRLFEEFIYSSPEGAHLNELERTAIEMTLVNNFARHSAVRCGWHVNEKSGRCDLHVLIASKNSDWPARLTIASEFGDGKKNIISVINRVSEEIILDLNETRATKLKSAMTVHRELQRTSGKPSLAVELAKAGVEEPEQLKGAIEGLGYEVTRESEETVSVKFPGKPRAKKYNKENLISNILDVRIEQMILEPAQPKEPEKPPGGGSGGAPPSPPKPKQPTTPSVETPKPKKEPKPWKPRIDWAAEAKKNKGKPDGPK